MHFWQMKVPRRIEKSSLVLHRNAPLPRLSCQRFTSCIASCSKVLCSLQLHAHPFCHQHSPTNESSVKGKLVIVWALFCLFLSSLNVQCLHHDLQALLICATTQLCSYLLPFLSHSKWLIVPNSVILILPVIHHLYCVSKIRSCQWQQQWIIFSFARFNQCAVQKNCTDKRSK